MLVLEAGGLRLGLRSLLRYCIFSSFLLTVLLLYHAIPWATTRIFVSVCIHIGACVRVYAYVSASVSISLCVCCVFVCARV